MGDVGEADTEETAGPTMSDVELDLLVSEAASERIGSLWLAEIRQACAEVSRRFSPTVYGVAEASWTDGEIDELVQDVTVEQLLRQGQLNYILDVSQTITDVHRLLRHQVRRALVGRRRRTIVDRLLTRIMELADDSSAYEQVPGATPLCFRPAGSNWNTDPPSEDGFRQASAGVRMLPTSVATGDRAPAVFRTEVLTRVLSICFDACETSLSIDDFGRIFRYALTSWVPVVLELNEDLDLESPDTVDLLSDLEQTVNLIIDELSDTHRTILRVKLSGLSDSVLAERLRVSRPTAAKFKSEAFAEVRDAWQRLAGDLSPAHDDQLAQLFYLRLGEEAGQ